MTGLLTEVTYRLGTDYLMDVDEGSTDHELEGIDYVLLSARRVFRTISLLEAGVPAAPDLRCHAEVLAPQAASSLADPAEHEICILALRWWLGVT